MFRSFIDLEGAGKTVKIRTNDKAGQSEVGGSEPQVRLTSVGETRVLESRPSGLGRMDTVPLGRPRGQQSRFL